MARSESLTRILKGDFTPIEYNTPSEPRPRALGSPARRSEGEAATIASWASTTPRITS